MFPTRLHRRTRDAMGDSRRLQARDRQLRLAANWRHWQGDARTSREQSPAGERAPRGSTYAVGVTRVAGHLPKPSPVKLVVSGWPRHCAESGIKDLDVIGVAGMDENRSNSRQ